VPGVVIEAVAVAALFFVRKQLTRSRSEQAVSDVKMTNRIRLFFMVVLAGQQHFQQLQTQKLKANQEQYESCWPHIFNS
jgi:hypothetical protein